MKTLTPGYYWCWNGRTWQPADLDEHGYWCVCGNDQVFKAEELEIWVIGPKLTYECHP